MIPRFSESEGARETNANAPEAMASLAHVCLPVKTPQMVDCCGIPKSLRTLRIRRNYLIVRKAIRENRPDPFLKDRGQSDLYHGIDRVIYFDSG